MKRILYALLIAVCATSCTDSTQQTEGVATADTIAPVAPPIDTIATEADTAMDSEHAIYYVTIVDTGSNYFALDRKMYDVSKATGMKIDTMARYYNTERNKIVLPDDDEDEIYRGEYYPRRSPDEYLSIEYLNFFNTDAGYETMVLISGIYGNRGEAEIALGKLKPSAANAFVMRASVFVGCMH